MQRPTRITNANRSTEASEEAIKETTASLEQPSIAGKVVSVERSFEDDRDDEETRKVEQDHEAAQNDSGEVSTSMEAAREPIEDWQEDGEATVGNKTSTEPILISLADSDEEDLRGRRVE